VAVFGTLRSIP